MKYLLLKSTLFFLSIIFALDCFAAGRLQIDFPSFDALVIDFDSVIIASAQHLIDGGVGVDVFTVKRNFGSFISRIRSKNERMPIWVTTAYDPNAVIDALNSQFHDSPAPKRMFDDNDIIHITKQEQRVFYAEVLDKIIESKFPPSRILVIDGDIKRRALAKKRGFNVVNYDTTASGLFGVGQALDSGTLDLFPSESLSTVHRALPSEGGGAGAGVTVSGISSSTIPGWCNSPRRTARDRFFAKAKGIGLRAYNRALLKLLVERGYLSRPADPQTKMAFAIARYLHDRRFIFFNGLSSIKTIHKYYALYVLIMCCPELLQKSPTQQVYDKTLNADHPFNKREIDALKDGRLGELLRGALAPPRTP